MGQLETNKADSPREVLNTVETFKKRLVELGLRSGVSGFPRRPRDRHILLKSIVLDLDPRTYYTEDELGATLDKWLREIGRAVEIDRVNLRRILIDEGYMGREKDGSRYWVSILGPPLGTAQSVRFEPEVDKVDVAQTITDGELELRLKKQRYATGAEL